MQLATRTVFVVGFLLMGFVSILLASEADKLRERAKAIHSEASVLAKQGKKDVAEKLFKESQELLKKAEQLAASATGKDSKDESLKVKLQDLVAQEHKLKETKGNEQELNEVREQIADIYRALKQSYPKQAKQGEIDSELKGLPPELQEHARNLQNAIRRIHHIRVAADNLKAAEIHDVSDALMERAEQMEREVREAKERLVAEMQRIQGTREKQKPESVEQELRAEIERLRGEVKELRQQIKPREAE